MTEPVQIVTTHKKTNIVFSASSFNLFEWCKRKYKYAHMMRKTLPVFEKPKPLDRGTIAHKGLEVYFNQLSQGIHFNDRMQATLMKMREVATDPAESNIDITEDMPAILSSVEQSCDFWRFEDEHLEILAVESPFDYILYEDDYIRIIISGKIDLMVNKPAMNGAAEYKNLPYDHKNITRDFPTDRLDNQFINYCAPTESNYLVVNKIGMQKTLKPEEKFKRIPISYDPIFIQQWKDNVVDVVLNDYLPSLLKNSFPMRMFNCRKFGRLCEFAKVCESTGDDAKRWKLESMYVEREPWDKYAEGEEEV